MTKCKWPVELLMCAILLSACDATSRNSIFGIFGTASQTDPAASNSPSAIIERLVPEENAPRRRVRTVIEATMRVTNRPRRDFPEIPQSVRAVLKELSVTDLQRIERLLPEVEANPQLQWD